VLIAISFVLPALLTLRTEQRLGPAIEPGRTALAYVTAFF
jgi:hypothetical protein